jgi:mono/diheme cytochrome c family protein
MLHPSSPRFLFGSALAWAVLAAGCMAAGADLGEAETTAPADSIGDFVEAGFPFIGTTVDARHLGPAHAAENVATRGLVLFLGNDSYAAFDPDLLRMAIGWQGEFMELTTMAQVSYREAGNKDNQIPRVLGSPVFTTGIYPGWLRGSTEIRDPRTPGPNPADVGRGPLPVEYGRWNGIYVVGEHAVLSYGVGGSEIREQPGSVAAGGEVGISRTFRIDRTPEPLALIVAELGEGRAAAIEGAVARVPQPGDSVLVAGLAGAPRGVRLEVAEGRYLVVRVPAGLERAMFRVVVWRGAESKAAAAGELLAQPVRMARFERGGRARWPQAVTTRGELSTDTAAYVVDRIGLPFPNRWRRDVRVADLAFFADGRRAAVVTFDGDVWIVGGLGGDLRRLRWRRFASGLYEPLGVEVVGDRIYTHSRDGITRLRDLNGDGEADFYESFSNLVVQSIESREFPLGFAARPGGGFLLGRGGALDMGPRTAQPILPGFRAGSRHSGSILEVSADGRSLTTYASGLREPFVAVHPERGLVTASDQEGNYVPATPVFLVPRGGYHGVPATAHRAEIPVETPPAVWIPHAVDPSAAGQAWVTDERMGFGGEALIHLSYGRPGAFRVYFDTTAATVQGAVVPLPATFEAPLLNGAFNRRDGHLYLAGFQIWGSRATEPTVLARVRYTGRPSPLPRSVRSAAQGVLVRFAAPLDSASATDPSRVRVQRWNYRRTPAYGSGHFRLDGSPGQETLPVAAAHLSTDRQTLLLVIPDMRPVMQMELGYDIRSADGRRLADTLYLTVHHAAEADLAEAGFAAVDWRGDLARAAERPARSEEAEVASAERGAQVFQRIGCFACHSVDGSAAGRLGPSLRGVSGSVRPLEDGSTRLADEAYLRESLVAPGAAVVRGYPNSMPSYLGVLSDAEIESLVLYIQSLSVRAEQDRP